MAHPITKADADGSKRVNVRFLPDHWRRIKKERRRVEAETGYKPSITDLLRRLVAEGLPK